MIARGKGLSVQISTPIEPGFEVLVFKAADGTFLAAAEVGMSSLMDIWPVFSLRCCLDLPDRPIRSEDQFEEVKNAD